jgi:dihydrofolate reductase
MTEYAIIVACTENGGIGKNGKIPWKISEDMQYFQTITTAVSDNKRINAVIMGRKTWESLQNGPLIGRINIIISNTLKNVEVNGAIVMKSLSEAHARLRENQFVGTIFVIGGERLYNEAIKDYHYTKIYLTNIYKNYDCDTHIDLRNIAIRYSLSKKGPKLISQKTQEEFSFDIYEQLP